MLRNRIITLGAVLLTTLALPGPVSAAVDAESVVTGKCTACHSAERIRESAMTEDEWTDLVDTEIDRGAQLSRAERAAVIDWLTEKYGSSGSEVVEAAETEEEAPETTEAETEAETDAESSESDQVEATTDELPFDRQADTGVELWQFLFTGGALMAGGVWMRRR